MMKARKHFFSEEKKQKTFDFGVSTLGLALSLVGLPAFARDTGHDPRPLAPSEVATFLPLACENPKRMSQSAPAYREARYRCEAIKGHGWQGMPGPPRTPDLALSAIAYGSFTEAGADEAYISYDGDWESHVHLFGGGILFTRQRGRWQLRTWVPAERRNNCLSLPDSAPQEMLCLQGDGHAARTSEAVDTTLTAQHVDKSMQSSGEAKTSYTLSRQVAAVTDNNFAECNDMRGETNHIDADKYPCARLKKGVGLLVGIDDLKRSNRQGIFAESSVAYMAPGDLEKACKATCYLDAPWKRGKIYFGLRGRTITVVMPQGLDLQPALRP